MLLTRFGDDPGIIADKMLLLIKILSVSEKSFFFCQLYLAMNTFSVLCSRHA